RGPRPGHVRPVARGPMTADEQPRRRGPTRVLGSPRRAALASLSVVLVAALVWLLLPRGQRGAGAARSTDAVAVGTPVRVDRAAPGFTQPLLSEHGSLSLQRYADRIVVLNFWASDCDACRSEGPALGRLATARLRFASPGPRTVAQGDPAVIHVVLDLQGGRLVPFSSLHLVPNEGHIHVYLGGGLVAMTAAATADVQARPGTHVLTAEFV